MVFVKEILEYSESRVYLPHHASAIAIAFRSAALGAESLAVFRAKKSQRKSEQQLLAERLVNVKLVAAKHNVFVGKLFKPILVDSSLCGNRALEIKRENSVNRSKTSCTLAVINKLCRKSQAHISAVVRKRTDNARVLKSDAV